MDQRFLIAHGGSGYVSVSTTPPTPLRRSRNDSGQTLAEYALILVFVVLLVAAVVGLLGMRARNDLGHAVDCLDPGTAGALAAECGDATDGTP